MNPTPEYRLLDLYDRVAEAPGAIDRLRKFVLDLAVRGKLVEQDSEDESASALLEQIAAEKERLVKAGKLKAARKPKKHSPAVELFELPHGWTWTSLQSICISISDGDHQAPPKAETGVPFLVIGDVRTQTINYEVERRVPQEYFDGLDPMRKPKSGDLLYTLVGSFGIPVPVLSNAPFCIQRHIGILRPAKRVNLNVLALFLESEFAFKQAEAAATGIAQKTVSLAGLRSMILPLPPLAEQHRIVAKVDELMALLDRLETTRTRRETTRDRLTTASLARLTAPETAEANFPTHACFALDNLDQLTSRPEQIKVLRQTILNLAVRGKLAEQDPADEPASEILKRIAEEKERLGLKRTVWGQEEEAPFELPAGWSWTCVGEICSKTGSGSTPRGGKAIYKNSGIPFLRSQNVYNDGLRLDDVAFIDPQIHERMKGTHVLAGDLLLNITGGSIGRCCRVPENFGDANVSQHVAIIRPALRGMERFLHCLIQSPYFQAFIFDEQTGAGRGGLPKNRMDKIAVALPPISEQHRIVAKVNALLAACDRLDFALTATDTTSARFLENLIQEALQSNAAVRQTVPFN